MDKAKIKNKKTTMMMMINIIESHRKLIFILLVYKTFAWFY